MSVFSVAAKNVMLDALSPDEVRLHDGDPGGDGTANRVGGANGVEAASFAAADEGERDLAAQVDFTGLDPDQSVTWYSAWDTSDGDVFLGKGQITQGATAADSSGDYALTTATSLRLDDPA